MGETRPRTRGSNQDGSAKISSDAAPSWRPARRRRLSDSDHPVSLEKRRSMVGTIGGGHDPERKGPVHVA